MTGFRTAVLLGALAALALKARAGERNAWPFWVGRTDDGGRIESWQAAGPLLFDEPAPDGGRWSGFRPFYLQHAEGGAPTEWSVLYPIFVHRTYGEAYSWSLFELINGYGRGEGAPAKDASRDRGFDLWPFYFSRDTGEPADSYRAVFPIGGTVKDRFYNDRISWVLFPLYLRTENHGAATTSTPWPFIRTTTGAASGFALWPLYGWKEKPGAWRRDFFLWPLGWNATAQPPADAPPGTPPSRASGFLPFYAVEHGPNLVNESYLWPFFGFTDRTAPYRYHEVRYFWPFFVQGRGEDHYRNRWGPFYTRSVMKGYDKTWVLWPLWRRARWSDGGLDQTKTQFCYVLYWSLEQRSRERPEAPPARRTHLWPLFSWWDNGAGRRQWQLFSPFDVFFPTNPEVRESWTPLFALARYDRRSPEEARGSLLWGAISWERRPGRPGTEVHLGPLKLVFSGKAR